MLEAKTVMVAMAYLLGIPVYVLGVLENYGSWKATVLFLLAAILLSLRIVFYFIRQNQQRKQRNMELERQRFELDREKYLERKNARP